LLGGHGAPAPVNPNKYKVEARPPSDETTEFFATEDVARTYAAELSNDAAIPGHIAVVLEESETAGQYKHPPLATYHDGVEAA
jgi:hypothetical protein